MKRFVSIFMVLLFVVTSSISVSYAEGRDVPIPVSPIIKALGAEMEWDEENRIVTIKKDDTTVEITFETDPGNSRKEAYMVKVNGVLLGRDEHPELFNNSNTFPVGHIFKIFENPELYGAIEGHTNSLLEGSKAAASGNVELDSDSTLDWVYWGRADAYGVDRKSGVEEKISGYTKLGTGEVNWFADEMVKFSWSSGAPTASAFNVGNMIFTGGEGNGFMLTVPANTEKRTLKLYVGTMGAKGRLEASLSDDRTPIYVEEVQAAGIAYSVFTINFKAADPGETLAVKYTVDTEEPGLMKNIMLQAAVLY